MKKYLTEFIGTFFLVLTVVLTANNAAIGPMAPLALGAVLMAMTLSGAPFSGGHFNPAITLAVLLCRKIDRGEALYYVMAQLAAGVFAATLGVYLHTCGNGAVIEERVHEQAFCAVLAEFLGVFAWVFVFLNVGATRSDTDKTPGSLAVGLVVIGSVYSLGGLSGGMFNPSAAVGASIAGMFAWGDFWVYVLGALFGAAAAATVFQWMDTEPST